MERISMLEIDKELEDLKRQIKDLLERDIEISCRLSTFGALQAFSTSQDWIVIHKDLNEISEYKYTKVTRFHLQSKVYDSVVYSIDYDYKRQSNNMLINIKPGNIILISDEKYELNICGVDFVYLNIEWKKHNKELGYEILLGSKVSTEIWVKHILYPSQTQGLIKEICLNLER